MVMPSSRSEAEESPNTPVVEHERQVMRQTLKDIPAENIDIHCPSIHASHEPHFPPVEPLLVGNDSPSRRKPVALNDAWHDKDKGWG
jgi:hypothetical protein